MVCIEEQVYKNIGLPLVMVKRFNDFIHVSDTIIKL